MGHIFRQYGEEFRRQHRLSLPQHQALNAIAACRTAQLGGHVDQCDSCGHLRISYNSCRNRHCPKCQSLTKERWLEAREAELLAVKYFHLVFTLPHELHPLIRMNEGLCYGLLFRAASQTLLQLAREKKYLHAQAGMMAVLHTWGQNLSYHPHLHCLVPAGGLSLDGKQWVHSRKRFFLPVKVLSRLFRGKCLAAIKEAFSKGQLKAPPQTALASIAQLNAYLSPLYRKEWVVYAKAPFGGPKQVIQYTSTTLSTGLGRYTHRVALSNDRILGLEEGKVRFHYKDYADGNKRKIMQLDVQEFIRRFMMHTCAEQGRSILPPGFHKIRYYGLLATRNRATKLAQARKALGQAPIQKPPKRSWQQMLLQLTGTDPCRCTACEKGRMHTVQTLSPSRAPPQINLPPSPAYTTLIR